jgi:hypothetical protein
MSGSNTPQTHTFFESRWIDEEFSRCAATSFDPVFASGPLLSGGEDMEFGFKARDVEVWGLGGPEGVEIRNTLRAQKEAMLNNQKQVRDKKQFASSAFDREYLLGDTFSAGSQARDKA